MSHERAKKNRIEAKRTDELNFGIFANYSHVCTRGHGHGHTMHVLIFSF